MNNNFFSRNKFSKFILFDLFASFISIYLSYLLRFNLSIPIGFFSEIIFVGTFTSLFVILALYFSKFYELIINYFGMRDLKKIFFPLFISSFLTFQILILVKGRFYVIPKSVPILYCLIFFTIAISIRILFRFFYEKKIYDSFKNKESALVIGAGDSAAGFLKNLKLNKWRVFGILDDDPLKHGKLLYGYEILGDINKIDFFVEKYSIKNIIFAIPSMTLTQRTKIFKKCSEQSLNIYILDILNEGFFSTPNQVRKIEIEDLLGRKEIQFDKKIAPNFFNSTILITGAGGSIGSELVFQIISLNPKKIICVDISEFNLYNLEEKILKINNLKTELIYLISDVKDKFSVSRIFALYKPRFVYHAAAYKHVPVLEKNINQAFANNVIGTYNLVNVAIKHKVEKFILISTDKAVEPINIMGATKRIAEKIILSCSKKRRNYTVFSIVRFGNVLGSSGSVIPKFKSQIERGGPISITHSKVTRFFMSIPEASKLVIEASFISSGSEIYMLDMGEPILIKDLAINMIKLSGLSLRDIKIKYIGLRPGEKLKEKLISNSENIVKSSNPRIMIIKSNHFNHDFMRQLNLTIKSLNNLQEISLKKFIFKLASN